MKYRRPRRKSPYWVQPEVFDNVVTYCRCYPVWVKELNTLPDSSKGISYDREKVQSSGNYDVTAETAFRRVELERKVELIRSTAKIASPELWQWIIKGTTEKDITIDNLIAQGMPASKTLFAKVRARFYYLLSKRI